MTSGPHAHYASDHGPVTVEGRQIILPDPLQGGEYEVGFEATLEGVLDKIHGRLGGKVRHTVLIFDGLATENSIRSSWDPNELNWEFGALKKGFPKQ